MIETVGDSKGSVTKKKSYLRRIELINERIHTLTKKITFQRKEKRSGGSDKHSKRNS